MPRRVEKHLISSSSPYFEMLFGFCYLAKNLYNHANYILRQKFIRENRIIGYCELDKLLKADKEYPDYRAMPLAQSAQQVLRILSKNWKGYFAAAKDYKQNPDKYLGRPKLPKYKKKEGLFVLTLTNQNCRLTDGVIKFPQKFNGFTVTPKFTEKPYKRFQQVRFIPTGTDIMLELVYEVEETELKSDNGKYAGIDILTAKRNRRIEDCMQKASRFVVEECAVRGVNSIIIGKNAGWKQESKLSRNIIKSEEYTEDYSKSVTVEQ